MEYKRTQKAYKIDFSKIEEGHLYSDMICYAETRNKAKTILLGESAYDNVCLKYSDEEVTYLTIPVIRCKGSDKYEFEGRAVAMHEIESVLRQRKRENKLKSFLNDPILTHCYIMKRGTYYRPNSSGYTSMKLRAGIYTIEEGVSDAISCNELWLDRTSKEDHNAMIEKSIAETKELILN